MRQSISLDIKPILKYLDQRHQIKNISLVKHSDYVDLVNNLIVFLQLHNVIHLQNLDIKYSNEIVNVTLALNKDKEANDFKIAINTLQGELRKFEVPVTAKKTTVLDIVSEIESELLTGLYRHKCIGLTSKTKDEIYLKHKNHASSFIYIDTQSNEIAKGAFDYFAKNGYKIIEESDSPYIYAFNKY